MKIHIRSISGALLLRRLIAIGFLFAPAFVLLNIVFTSLIFKSFNKLTYSITSESSGAPFLYNLPGTEKIR